MTREITPRGHLLAGLTRALETAEPDELGIRWAKARKHRVGYVACRRPDGTLILEEKRTRYGVPFARRLTAEPPGLVWRPIQPAGG